MIKEGGDRNGRRPETFAVLDSPSSFLSAGVERGGTGTPVHACGNVCTYPAVPPPDTQAYFQCL